MGKFKNGIYIYSPLRADVIIAGRQTDYARKKMRDKLQKELFQDTLKELAKDKALAAEKEAKARKVDVYDTVGTHNDSLDSGNSQEKCSDTGHAQDDLENKDKKVKGAERQVAEVEQARNKRIQKMRRI
jgi:hypothetical protein